MTLSAETASAALLTPPSAPLRKPRAPHECPDCGVAHRGPYRRCVKCVYIYRLELNPTPIPYEKRSVKADRLHLEKLRASGRDFRR